jgi:hypothetical protein
MKIIGVLIVKILFDDVPGPNAAGVDPHQALD